MENIMLYNNIIFDLDNTIYNQYYYDQAIFIKYFLSQNYNNADAFKIGTALAMEKNNAPYGYNKTFNDFICREGLNIKLESLLNFYRFPPVVNIKTPTFIKQLLNSIKHKNLILITNGYLRVQYNKIISLGISSYFNQILILSPEDSLALKPSEDALKFIYLKLGPTVYIGDDSLIDKGFANNCKFDFINFDIRKISDV